MVEDTQTKWWTNRPTIEEFKTKILLEFDKKNILNKEENLNQIIPMLKKNEFGSDTLKKTSELLSTKAEDRVMVLEIISGNLSTLSPPKTNQNYSWETCMNKRFLNHKNLCIQNIGFEFLDEIRNTFDIYTLNTETNEFYKVTSKYSKKTVIDCFSTKDKKEYYQKLNIILNLYEKACYQP